MYLFDRADRMVGDFYVSTILFYLSDADLPDVVAKLHRSCRHKFVARV